MPQHDFAAARAERAAKAAADPLSIVLVDGQPPFVFRWGINTITFIDMFVQSAHKLGVQLADDRAYEELVCQCVLDEHADRLRATLRDTKDPIDSETLGELFAAVWGYYMRGNPTPGSSSSSADSSTTGENSTAGSSNPPPVAYD